MKISKIIKHINRIAGQGSYTFEDLADYIDEAIDTINEDLLIYLPTVRSIYENNFTLTESEEARTLLASDDPNFLDYVIGSLENDYTRIPDAYIRNYICYEVAYRIARDEDEDEDVLYPKKSHSNEWYKKLVAIFNDYTLEDTEAVTIGGDADELDSISIDDTGVGFYNPIDPIDNQ